MMRRMFLVIISIVSGCLVSTQIARYYYVTKSTTYGLIPPTIDIPLDQYGKRSSAIVELLREKSGAKAVLGSADPDNTYTIAVIGDSYVWGQGIKDEERFANLLQGKLSAIRPTRVISLAVPGDSMMDNYLKYVLYAKNHRLDMTIFAFVDNDLLFRKKNMFDQQMQNDIMRHCDKPLVWNVDSPEFTDKWYEKAKRETYRDSYGNLCVLQTILDMMPKDKHILFFNFGDNWGSPFLITMFTQEVVDHGFPVVSTVPLKDGPYLYVSKQDPHPSAYANSIFADSLYKVITDRWNEN